MRNNMRTLEVAMQEPERTTPYACKQHLRAQLQDSMAMDVGVVSRKVNECVYKFPDFRCVSEFSVTFY